jgi:AcrR family transcriptional regulator
VQSCIELYSERGLVSISVAEIARRAGINRATFYRHFEDKADLLERGIEGLLEDTVARIDTFAAGAASLPVDVTTRIGVYGQRLPDPISQAITKTSYYTR